MKRTLLTPALLWLGLIFFASPVVVEAQNDMQRFFRIHNELDTPIFPIIQAGQKANCVANYPLINNVETLLRIVVNGAAGRDKGITKGETVLVKIPKTEAGCGKDGLFYIAARVMIFTVSPEGFDSAIKIQPYAQGNATNTEFQPPWGSDLCFKADGTTNLGASCWAAKATADYGTDAPFQLIEYTIISRVGADNSPNGPNDPNGVSNFGYNISYVDSIHLPVAMGMGGGATPYLGAVTPGTVVEMRMADFVSENHPAKWSGYASWSQRQFEGATDAQGMPIAATTAFRTINGVAVPRSHPVPSAQIVLSGVRNTGVDPVTGKDLQPPSSPYTYDMWDGITSKRCKVPDTNPPNSACVTEAGLNCCTQPFQGAVPEVFNDCCDTPVNAKIDGLSRSRPGMGQPLANKNRTLTAMTTRWLNWQNDVYDCNNPPIVPGGPLDSPVKTADKTYFCNHFKQGVKFLWQQFTQFKTTDKCEIFGPPTRVPNPTNPDDPYNQCIVTAIIGFTIDNSSTGFDPGKCAGSCPNEKPALCLSICTDQYQRQQTTIALQRDVPFNGPGDPNTCAKCPSTNEADCPRNTCVQPVFKSISVNAKQYEFDKWLHFWAPYDSPYNLNPYARFVHDPNGLNALSAYGFSIDDFYGFVGDDGTMIIVSVGGDAGLDDRDPRDPFNKYEVNLGTGWDSVKVCGRTFKVPPGGAGFPISFWKPEGGQYAKKQYCQVVAFSAADKTKVLVALLQLITYNPTDEYTGQQHVNVETLSGGLNGNHTWVDRFDGGGPVTVDKYCLDNSNLPNKAVKCQIRLAPVKGSAEEYVGVKECASSQDQTCGRPLIKLILGDAT